MESMGVAIGCGCKEVYIYIYIDFLVLLILLYVLFCSSIPTFCSFFFNVFHLYRIFCQGGNYFLCISQRV